MIIEELISDIKALRCKLTYTVLFTAYLSCLTLVILFNDFFIGIVGSMAATIFVFIFALTKLGKQIDNNSKYDFDNIGTIVVESTWSKLGATVFLVIHSLSMYVCSLLANKGHFFLEMSIFSFIFIGLLLWGINAKSDSSCTNRTKNIGADDEYKFSTPDPSPSSSAFVDLWYKDPSMEGNPIYRSTIE